MSSAFYKYNHEPQCENVSSCSSILLTLFCEILHTVQKTSHISRLTHPVNFPGGVNRSARRKPMTFGRALTDYFHTNQQRESNLRTQRRKAFGLTAAPTKPHSANTCGVIYKSTCGLLLSSINTFIIFPVYSQASLFGQPLQGCWDLY